MNYETIIEVPKGINDKKHIIYGPKTKYILSWPADPVLATQPKLRKDMRIARKGIDNVLIDYQWVSVMVKS